MSRVVRPNDRTLRNSDIRLIDEQNNPLGIVSFADAVERASGAGLDLVLVADKATPPVCRIMNYGKIQYQRSKRERDQRKKQTTQKLKEVKFHSNIDQHDYKIKINHIVDFLEKGFRVKVSLFFRGREMAHRDIGRQLLERVAGDIGEHGSVDMSPRMAGRSLTMQIAPGSLKQ